MENNMKFLSTEASLRLLKLAQQPYRPPQIIKLKEDIETKIRDLELKASTDPMDGVALQDRVQEIVHMKFALDRLYGLWAEGKIQ